MLSSGDRVTCPFCLAVLIVGLKYNGVNKLTYGLIGNHNKTPKNPNNVKCESIEDIREHSLDDLRDSFLTIKKP